MDLIGSTVVLLPTQKWHREIKGWSHSLQ